LEKEKKIIKKRGSRGRNKNSYSQQQAEGGGGEELFFGHHANGKPGRNAARKKKRVFIVPDRKRKKEGRKLFSERGRTDERDPEKRKRKRKAPTHDVRRKREVTFCLTRPGGGGKSGQGGNGP